jgi:hypothetical protein
LIREVFANQSSVRIADLQRYCGARIYRVGAELPGALQLLQNLDVFAAEDDYLRRGAAFDAILGAEDVGLAISIELLKKLTDSGEIRTVFKSESISVSSDRSEIFVHPAHVPYKYLPLVRLLRDLKAFLLLADDAPFLQVAPGIASSFVLAVQHFQPTRRRKMSPEALASVLEAQARQGAEAEEFVVRFERQRLEGHSRAELIFRISLSDVSAGYDIQSFSSVSALLPDRFIEVKSFRDNLRFFLSAGEIKTAKELGKLYFLYLVDMGKIAADGYEPIMLNSPVDAIFGADSIWNFEAESYEVFPKQ